MTTPISAAIRQSLKLAMRSKDTAKATVLRSVLADLQNSAHLKQAPSESKILAKAISRRQEASTQVSSRPDLYETYQREIEILKELVPSQESSSSMSTEEIEKAVREILKSGGNELLRSGPLIKAVREQIQDKADGKAISTVVDRVLKSEKS